MIRNVKKASNVDVELYMASHTKLHLQLQKLIKDVSGLKKEYVEDHLGALDNLKVEDVGDLDKKAKKSQFVDDHIFPIVDFGRKFGVMAKHQLAQIAKKKEMDNLSNQLNILKLQQERLNQMKADTEDLDVNNKFKQTVDRAEARIEEFV